MVRDISSGGGVAVADFAAEKWKAKLVGQDLSNGLNLSEMIAL